MKPRRSPTQANDDTCEQLTRALTALDAGNDADAITALVEVWTKRRSPAIAELVDLLDARQPKRALDGVIATRVETSIKRLAGALWLVSDAPIARRLERVVVASALSEDLEEERQAHDILVDVLTADAFGRVPVVGIVPPWRS